MAVFAIADTLKDTSVEAIKMLKERGVRTAMLTGDSKTVAASIAGKVGIQEYFAEALPEDKAKAVERVRSVGGFVAMGGDGINDSPALKSADVGVAIGTGTDIAIDSADVVLVGGDIRAVSTMIDLSKATVRNIKQNLFWAFFYNVVAIPVAAGALEWLGVTLDPMIAAACMSLSSLFVVTNALRLTRFGKKKAEKNNLIKDEEQVDFVAQSNETIMSENDNYDEKGNTGMKKTMRIEGMMCKHCVAHATKALLGIEGVETVEVSLEAGEAIVCAPNEIADEVLTAAIIAAGYEVIEIK